MEMATTSAPFVPHFERIRSASSVGVTFRPTQACESLGRYLPAGAALAHHAHQKIAEAIVQASRRLM
jgi:hypothetical protein